MQQFCSKYRRALMYVCLALAPSIAHAQPGAGEAHWNVRSASQLVEFVENAGRHGLDPSAYEVEGLAAAIERSDALAIEIASASVFSSIAHHLQSGVTQPEDRFRWRIDGPVADEPAITAAMQAAIETGRIGETLDAFAPQHAEYLALQTALAAAGRDEDFRSLIARNMERWRWMPRNLDENYVLVNVPSYEAIVVRGGKEVARHRVVVGARKTPTPQFSAWITGVVLNPTWFVPKSIVAESVGALLEKRPEEAERQGYYVAEDGGVRQKPGPANALGQMKLAMPNAYSVFLHDTPQRRNFELDRRALSHGCIRVDDALGFAATVLGEGWTKELVDGLTAAGTTVAIDLVEPVPVYIVYFTAMTNAAGEVAAYPDIYKLDRTVLSSMYSDTQTVAADVYGECPAETTL